MEDDGGTVVSAADMIHFKFLANPTVVDVTDVDAVDVEEDATSPIRDAAGPSFPTITPEDEATSFGLLADAASLPRTPVAASRAATPQPSVPSTPERAPSPLPPAPTSPAPLPDTPDVTQDRAAPPANDAPMSAEEELLAKRTVLLDLARLEASGIKLTKEWTQDDSLEDMTLEMRRHVLIEDERANVSMMRDGLRMLVTGIEVVNKRFRVLDLDGWSAEATRDLDKHDANLARIYRKYWRRGSSRNPEMEIAMSLFGSMGMYHLKSSMGKHLLFRSGGGEGRPAAGPSRPLFRRAARKPAKESQPDDSSTDEEEAPR